MAWTTRSDLVGAVWAQLQAFQAANPTLLHNAYRSRPKSFADRPCGYVGNRGEQLTYMGATVRRDLTASVVIVYAPKDMSEELADVQDDLVDAFLEYGAARPAQVNGRTLTQPRQTEDVELELDGAYYPATIVTYTHVDQKGDTAI